MSSSVALQTTSRTHPVPRPSRSPTCFCPRPVSRRHPRGVVAQASSNQAPAEPVDPILRFSSAIGLDTTEGLFGFKPFSEQWTGRLAMMGFLTSIVEEFHTGRGTLAQMHLMQPGAPSPVMLALLVAIFGGATVYGTLRTISDARSKKLSPADIERYKSFLSLQNEAAQIRAEATAMKRRGDFTTPGLDMAAIQAAKAEGAPVDAFLSTAEVAEGEAAARKIKAQQQAAGGSFAETSSSSSSSGVSSQEKLMDAVLASDAGSLAYAREVELRNGRWAMLGFLAAVLVEAATGNGIIGQVIQYLKWANVLGPDSGF